MRDLIAPPSTLPAGARVWAYLRDSGGDSQEQSVGQQEREIVRYCDRHGLALARIFTDEARTGGTDRNRDLFTEMVDSTADPKARPVGLLVWSLSRFARNQTDAPYYRAILRKRGVVIHSLTEMLPDDPTSIVIEAVYDFTNAEKLRQTSRDVKRALHELVSRGYAPGGVPPTGYIAVREVIGRKRDGTDRVVPRWVEDPERWAMGCEAWRAFDQGATYNDLQLATGGKFFSDRTMWSYFFRNRTYTGLFIYGGIEYPDHHPAMVDPATFERVQTRLKANQAKKHAQGDPNHPRRLHHPTLLSGLATCAHCGSAICYRPDPKRNWEAYICGLKVRRNSAACPSRRVSARKADRAVLDGVINQVLDVNLLGGLMAEVESQLGDTDLLDREARRLDKDIAENKGRIANLMDYLKTFGSGAVRNELAKEESSLAELEVKRNELEHRRRAARLKVTPEAIVTVFDIWRGELAQARADGDVVRSQRLLRHFVSEVKLEYNRATVEFSFPIDGSGNGQEALWGRQ